MFDESTLPPRTHLIFHSRKSKPAYPPNASSSALESLQRSTSPSKDGSSSSPRLKNGRTHLSDGQSPEPHLSVQENETGENHSLVGDQEARVDPSERSLAVEPAQDGEQIPVAQDLEVEDSTVLSKPSLHTTTSPKHVNTSAPGPKTSFAEASATTTDSGPRLSVAGGRQPSRSPPVLAPQRAGADPQSSPASTNGPDSSNTPAPTAGSPGTSPGIEVHPTSESTREGKSTDEDLEESERSLHDRGERSQKDPSGLPASTADVEMTDPEDLQNPPMLSIEQNGTTPTPTTRRLNMRIETQTEIDAFFKPQPRGAIVDSPAQMTAIATPNRDLPATPSTQEPSKRATRISSGVLQKKSVSEILGETPKPSTPQGDSPSSASYRDSFGISTPQDRPGERDRRDRERSRLSTVVFAKPQKPLSDGETLEVSRVDDRETQRTSSGERDYLYTLFEHKAHSMSRQTSMTYLIQNAHKTLSTSDHLVEYELSAESRILKRLYQLQEKQRWALRQYKRADEASRPTCHWDLLLDHMKWMRTDFREERKWKLAAARSVAESCVEWVASSPEARKQLQVRIRPAKAIPKADEPQDINMEDGAVLSLSSAPTPELMPSNEDDSMSDDIADPGEVQISAVPAALFSLGASEFNFAVDQTHALDKLLNELPLYEPSAVESNLPRSTIAERLDGKWRTDIVPVSRWATEKLPVKEYKPPVKRSRYEYELEPSPAKTAAPLPPEEINVALFMPENKHIRDRIHPGHSFRPPSEHPMPTQAFFETRSSSQWTHAEDDELRKLVKDYSYNWSLISSCLTPRSSYTSGADRRTPWECFERWIGLEGLPADMSKTAYFKTYSGRIEAAGRHVAAQIEEAQRRAGINVQISSRKRTTQPVRVERKRTQRHLAMLDAMRKLAKKRETALQKQQHQADLVAMRKANDANVPKPAYKTPAEFSQLKQEREQKMAERQEIYRQQLIAHQRATAQQQRGQNAQANGIPNGMPPGGPVMRGPPSAGGMPPMPNGNLQIPNGHNRHPGMMAMQGNVQVPPGLVGPKGLTPQMQAQMQAQLAARGVATSPQQIRMLQEASRVQQEQLMRQAQQAQQAQNGVHSSPNNPHAVLAAGKGMNNAAYMSAMAGANGIGSPSPRMNGAAASPRPNMASSGQALSSGHIPVLTQIANKIREHHPNLSEEEVQSLASQQITSYQQQATAAAAGQTHKRPQTHQAALNAAMGAVNAGNHAAANQFGHAGMMTNEQVQQYNQRMRMQQAQQHAVRGMQGPMQPGVIGAMPNGMSNSPVMNMARPVSQHTNQGQMSRSATPRDQGSGSQGNVTGTASGQ